MKKEISFWKENGDFLHGILAGIVIASAIWFGFVMIFT